MGPQEVLIAQLMYPYAVTNHSTVATYKGIELSLVGPWVLRKERTASMRTSSCEPQAVLPYWITGYVSVETVGEQSIGELSLFHAYL